MARGKFSRTLWLAAAVLGATTSARAPGAERDSAVILDQPDLPRVGQPSSPAAMAEIFTRLGWEVRRVSAAELARPETLKQAPPTVVVLPQGAAFPVEARDALERYLQGGGNLIATGGYALNAPVRSVDGRWVCERERLDALRRQAMTADRSLPADGGFERYDVPVGGFSLDGRWRCAGPHGRVVDEAAAGRKSFLCDLPKDRVAEGAHAWLDLPAKPGAAYEISAQVRTEDVTGRGIAFAAVYQYDAADKLVEFYDFVALRGTNPWRTYRFGFSPKPAVRRLHVSLGFYEAGGKAWFDDVRLGDVTGLEYRPMNTAAGRPADGLETAPLQMGMFDAHYPLRRVRRLCTAAGQHVVRRVVELDGPFTGWAASGVTARGNARWIPLIDAVDRYGRSRGPAAGMLIHHGGPFAGSCWAYFGVDNVDLFASPDGPAAEALRDVARFLRRKVFLRGLKASPVLLRPGESPIASVLVENRGRAAGRAKVELTARPRGLAKTPPAVVVRECEVAAGASQSLEARFPPPAAGVGGIEVTARLSLDGQPVDVLDAGVVAEDPAVLRSAPPLRFQNNYFTLADRPTFLFGCDTYGVVYSGAGESPASWSRELTAARDIGMQLYEVLQPTPGDCRVPDADWRAFGALNQLVHSRRMVFMPGMLIGRNVAIGDAELQRESDVCREYARRLGASPSLLWYLNGDYALEAASRPDDVRRLWNRWLAGRYDTLDALRAVWGAAAANQPWGDFAYPPANSGAWDDAAAVDRADFEAWLTSRWNRSHVEALRGIDPKHPITSEYYAFPIGGLDLVRTIDPQDVSNVGFFDPPGADLEMLPLRLCWNDLRARGKGVSLGEYGVKTHPAWNAAAGATGYHIMRTEAEQRRLFAAVAHYALGLGACKVQNWCLRDDAHWVFPWGLFYPNQLVPKDVAFLHRNQSLVWRFFAPVYRPAPLYVGLANRLRCGNEDGLGASAAYRAFADLLALHYPFGVVDDDHLEHLPAPTRALLLPTPLAMSDASFAKLVGWVRAGGFLIATGDFSRDERRRANRAGRLRELAGLECAAPSPLPLRAGCPSEEIDFRALGLGTHRLPVHLRAKPVDCNVLARRADGNPVLVRRQLGLGTVVFLASPIEMDDGQDARAFRRRFYAAVLRDAAAGHTATHRTATGADAAGALPDAALRLAPLGIAPDDPRLHVFRQPTARGSVHVVCNTKPTGGHTDIELPTAGGALGLRVPDGWPVLAAVGDDGKLLAAASAGTVRWKSAPLAESTALCTFLALDGKDLAEAEAVLVAPSAEGSVRFPGRKGEWTALVGEFRAGSWTTLERLDRRDPSAAIALDADRATCLTIFCRRGTESRWTEFLSLAIVRPDELPPW
jgi:hypothetical protein